MSPEVFLKAQIEVGGSGLLLFLVVFAFFLAAGAIGLVWWLINRAPARDQSSARPHIARPPLLPQLENASARETDTSAPASLRENMDGRRERV